MTGRTHDLAALTTLTIFIATEPLIKMSLATALVAVAGNMIGGVAPDLDQPTGNLWHKIPAGTIFGKIAHPFLGSHRSISHSILGMAIFGWLTSKVLTYMHSFLLTDMNIVWWAFMFGYFSHLIVDSLTKEGVPWLFPISIRFGFPPVKALRIKTGKFIENALIFPGLLILNGILVYNNYEKYISFIKHYITK